MSGSSTLKIGTWNVFSGLPWSLYLESDKPRLAKITTQIKNSDLDVLALQEVASASLVNKLKEALGEKYDFYYNAKNTVLKYVVFSVAIILLWCITWGSSCLGVLLVVLFFALRTCTAYSFLLSEVCGG